MPRRPAKKRPAISEKQLIRWRLIEDFQERLESVIPPSALHPTWDHPARQMQLADYLSLLLLGLLNPIVKTMRALCAASQLERMQEEICQRPVSLGSFSEAQAVVDPALLQSVFEDLVQSHTSPPCFGDGRLAKYQKVLMAVDSTLWAALPRMGWAIWRGQDKAARLHVKFSILEQRVLEAKLTDANVCERRQWKAVAKAGEFYVGDRNFGEDYQLLRWMQRRDCSYVVRLRQVSQWVEEQLLEVTDVDRAAGVTWQGWVRLGKKGDGARVRLVRIGQEADELLLITDRNAAELPAELVGLIYRYRWQIELFFRWLKCIFGCRHWLMHSQQGAATQIYLALIAAQLLVLYGAPKPSKRQMELLQLYLLGWASKDELCAGLKLDLSQSKKA